MLTYRYYCPDGTIETLSAVSAELRGRYLWLAHPQPVQLSEDEWSDYVGYPVARIHPVPQR